MKIFIQDYVGTPMEFDQVYKQTLFYCDEGICLLKDHKLYKQLIQQNKGEQIAYRHFEFLVDYTTFEDGDILYHIPYKHRCCEEEYSKKDLGQGLYFVRKKVLDQTSYYFECKQLESFMFPKMFTFLM
jgi:hypothetical protein